MTHDEQLLAKCRLEAIDKAIKNGNVAIDELETLRDNEFEWKSSAGSLFKIKEVFKTCGYRRSKTPSRAEGAIYVWTLASLQKAIALKVKLYQKLKEEKVLQAQQTELFTKERLTA